MTEISREDVLHLAQLSQLQLSDDDVTQLTAELADILGYVQQLDELDTSDAQPTYQVTGLQNVWRDDVVETSQVSREELLALAPESTDTQIKVPKVL